MRNMGTYEVYLTGSKKTVKRTIYKNTNGNANKFYVKYYGQMIEVKQKNYSFSTVEKY